MADLVNGKLYPSGFPSNPLLVTGLETSGESTGRHQFLHPVCEWLLTASVKPFAKAAVMYFESKSLAFFAFTAARQVVG